MAEFINVEYLIERLMKQNTLRIAALLVVCSFRGGAAAQPAEIHYDPPPLAKQLQAALRAKGTEYRAASAHRLPDGQPAFVNRLLLEHSPYLLQHAHNPVNWYPWISEAFSKAQAENKAVFLSIGYSTCHWCHVMERESFDNLEIAALLNKHFVSIKVDREQRPDIDAVYMAAVELIVDSGGWPLNGFLTPQGKMFLGGGYFPPQQFKKILSEVAQLWRQQPQALSAQAETVAAAVAAEQQAGEAARTIDTGLLNGAVDVLLRGFDAVNGGFGDEQKFPGESRLLFLLDSAQRLHRPDAFAAVQKTLDAMAQGGIYDQIGGGFHRYATDPQWRLPHFEKMLYNQAQLARLYLQAYRLTGEPGYARIAHQTLDFVLRELRAPEGGFYTALDADSGNGEEGGYFLWTAAEIRQILPADLAALAMDLYGVDMTGRSAGGNVLYLAEPLASTALRRQVPLALLRDRTDRIGMLLRRHREQRSAPFRDDKILTAGNAMMIRTLALAAAVLPRPDYAEAARRAAEFIWNNRTEGQNGILWHAFWQGKPSLPANQEDYAYFAEAMLQLYDLDGDTKWLNRARQTADTMLATFWDERQGGFFMALADDAPLPQRAKSVRDSEIPSANAVAIWVLSRLAGRTGESAYAKRAQAALAACAAQSVQDPLSHAALLTAAAELLYGETGAQRYAAEGAVKLAGEIVYSGRQPWLEVAVTIKPGWHINAHRLLQDNVHPTSLALSENGAGWELDAVEYPPALQKQLHFRPEKLALYENSVLLRAALRKTGSASANLGLPVQIGLQACSDEICLAPETIVLHIPVPSSPWQY